MTYVDLGVPRLEPITDEDERGPDSVECLSAILGGFLRHDQCLLDYTALGPPQLVRDGTTVTVIGGFVCGCVCHDPESRRGADARVVSLANGSDTDSESTSDKVELADKAETTVTA